MYNHNKAQQSKNRVHISWDILYRLTFNTMRTKCQSLNVSRITMQLSLSNALEPGGK